MEILVKSKPEFWEKEKRGLKPNTVRVLDGFDKIEIMNTETKDTFIRTITDISVFGKQIIISFEGED